jgi:hypothetical protein
MISSYTYHTLFNHPVSGSYNGMTYGAHSKTTAELMSTPCAVWRSDTQATELSDSSCGTTDPEFELCAPNKYGVPMLEAVRLMLAAVPRRQRSFMCFCGGRFAERSWGIIGSGMSLDRQHLILSVAFVLLGLILLVRLGTIYLECRTP